jgi:hypothetical protein
MRPRNFSSAVVHAALDLLAAPVDPRACSAIVAEYAAEQDSLRTIATVMP